jgi:hypothetical protein
MSESADAPRIFPFFEGLLGFGGVNDVWRCHPWQVNKQLSVLNAVVGECGKMASDILAPEKCSDICVESVAIGFQARTTLLPQTPLFFCFWIGSLPVWRR